MIPSPCDSRQHGRCTVPVLSAVLRALAMKFWFQTSDAGVHHPNTKNMVKKIGPKPFQRVSRQHLFLISVLYVNEGSRQIML